MGSRLGSAPAVYLPHRDWNIGPIQAAPAEWIPRALRFAEGTSEEFLLATPDATRGLFLAFHRADHEHGEPFPYELALWGDDWISAAAGTLPFHLSRTA